jgi:predicted ribosome quality control (RQC) complex YloA/Tae2 family protein
MQIHQVTLKFLSNWLSETLTGKQVHEVFSQSRNELIISFEQSGKQPGLRISVEPHKNFVYLLQDIQRAKRNTINLFPSVIGKTVIAVTAHQYDRILFLNCSEQFTVAILMYGSSANVLVINDQNVVVDAFAHAKETIGKPFVLPSKVHAEPVSVISPDEFLTAVLSTPHETLRDVLKSLFPTLGKTLMNEILYQGQYAPTVSVKELSDEEKKNLYRIIINLHEQLAHPAPRIYYDLHSPVTFSLIPLMQFSGYRCEEIKSINDALRVYVSKSLRDEHFDQEYNDIQRRILVEQSRIERTMGKIRHDLTNSDRAVSYELYGKILMTYAGSLTQSQENVILEDPLTGKPVSIPLDRHLTPIQNAGKYFTKAKKSRAAHHEAEERLQTLEKTSSELHMLHEAIVRCSTGDDLKDFKNTYKKQLQGYHMVKNAKEEPAVPFRVFHVTGGFEVWAGKSSKNNDELTLHHAKPNDLWFHARGSSGSHVVLRIGTGNGEPSKRAKEQAAAIAAYYSKQRNAKYVPVAVTEKKNVRKPKGATPGTVVIDREKVMMVSPALPVPEKDES